MRKTLRFFIDIIADNYKSGNKRFDREKVEAGLDLQLMVYLEGALGSEKGLKPAGVFYYAVKDPEAARDFADVIASAISDDLADRLAGDFALDGVAVSDPGILSAIDTEITDGDPSATKVFDPRKRSGFKGLISEEDMEELRSSFRQKLTEICEGVLAGNIDIKPAFFKNENVACGYCQYSSVCLETLKH